jgi:hypothetical protein
VSEDDAVCALLLFPEKNNTYRTTTATSSTMFKTTDKFFMIAGFNIQGANISELVQGSRDSLGMFKVGV